MVVYKVCTNWRQGMAPKQKPNDRFLTGKGGRIYEMPIIAIFRGGVAVSDLQHYRAAGYQPVCAADNLAAVGTELIVCRGFLVWASDAWEKKDRKERLPYRAYCPQARAAE